MNTRKRSLFMLSLLIVMSMLLTACGGATATPKAPEAPEPTKVEAPAPEPTEAAEPEPTEVAPLDPPAKVMVAFVPIMKFATMYVAKESGFFEAQGLDVELQPVKSGTEAIAFLSEGTVDVGGIAIVVSMWNAWNQGIDLRLIAPGGREPMENSPTKFLVRKDLVDDGTVTDIADLAGMTVAVAGGPGSGGEYLAAKALERGALTIFDVELVNVGNADMPAAFENGSIDAGLLGSPYADQTINAGHSVAMAEDLTPGLMTVAFVGSGKFVSERQEVAQRFVLALMEAARAMQGDDYLSDENIAAYLAYVNATEESIRSGNPVIYEPDQQIPFEGLADIERVHRENGRLEYTEPLDLNTAVDASFVEWALSIIGPYGQ